MNRTLWSALAGLLASSGLTLAQSPESALGAPESVAAPAPQSSPALPPAVSAAFGPASGTDACRVDRGPTYWGSADYLLWWVKAAPVPVPLLTTFAPGTPSAATGFGGAFGVPGTTVLSPDHLGYRPFSGGRLLLGGWIDSEQRIGVEATGFLTESRSAVSSFQSNLNGSPNLRVPFVNTPPGAFFPPGESSFVLAIPGFANGAQALTSTLRLWGAEGRALLHVINNDRLSVSLLTGFRYLDLKEGLTIADRETLLAGGFGTFVATDGFQTRNQFYGGQLGAKAQANFGRYFATILGDVSLGANHESITVSGNSAITSPAGATLNTPGGIFAQQTNIGRQTQNPFAVIPEVQLRFGVNLTSTIRAYVGYDFFYVSNVARPGDQIDRVLNFTGNPAIAPGTALTGAARPAPQFNHTDFWAQGITAGLIVRY